MAAKKQDFSSICNDIKQGHFAPVYLLHGEESYFIDKITDLLLEYTLTEDEKDFNLTQFYGGDLDNMLEVISTCRRYPMMAERQVVFLHELQAFNNRSHAINTLSLYLENPLKSTIFVIIYKTKKMTGDIPKLVTSKGGVIFESSRVPEYQNKLTNFVKQNVEERGLTIEPKALELLCNSIGSDLSRIFNEIDKLQVNLEGKKITHEAVAKQVGVSKDFNVFELVSAVAAKDFYKVELIKKYFISNPKVGPNVMVFSQLFNFFSNLMLAYYCPDKSVNGLMEGLKISYPSAKDLNIATKNYTAWKAMSNISAIREYDAKQKGARDNTPSEPRDQKLLEELLFNIMH